MNRIFKIVYNHLMGRHVVVSEVAGSVQRGTCRLVAAAVMAFAGLGLSSSVMAKDMGYSYDAGVILTTDMVTEDGQAKARMVIQVVRGDVHDNSHQWSGQYTQTEILAKLESQYNDGLIAEDDYKAMVTTINNADNTGSRYYTYSILQDDATAEFGESLHNETVERLGRVLKPGENVALNIGDYLTVEVGEGDDKQTVYVDHAGKPLINEDGSYVTDKADIPLKEDGTPDAIVAEYKVHAGNSRVTGVTSEEQSDGSTVWTITQKTVQTNEDGSAQVNDDGTVKYEDQAFTFTDTNTKYTLEGGSGGDNAATVNLTPTGGSTGGAGTVTIQGGGNVTVSAEGNTITIAAKAGADANTEYEGKAAVTAGSDYGKGSARFGVYEKAPAESKAAGDLLSGDELVLQAGDNVKIETDSYGAAVISAKDTTYTVKAEAGTTGNVVNTYTLMEHQSAGDEGTAVKEAIVDTDTKYKAEQQTVAGKDYGRGYTTITVSEANGQQAAVGSATIMAGKNVMIDAYGTAAIISAKDTTYTHEVTEGSTPGVVSTLTITNDLDKTDTITFNDTDTRNTVVAGNNITVDPEENPDDGSIQYTIHGKDTKVTSDDSSVTVTETVDEKTGVTTYDLSVQGVSSEMDYAGDTGTATVKSGNTVNVVGGATELTDNNIGVVAEQDGDNAKLTVKLAKDIKDVDSIQVNKSVTVGKTTINNEGVTIQGGPTITKTNVDMGGQQVHNVAAGTADTDAVNVSQLRQYESGVNANIDHLNDRIGDVAKDANAGIAMAMAAASLPQAVLPGKSMFAVAGGTYRGEQGYAIGFSTITDNGKWIIKADASGNSRSHYGASVSVGYLW